MKIVDYFLSQLGSPDSIKFLEEQIDEYNNKWFLLQNEINIEVLALIDNIKNKISILDNSDIFYNEINSKIEKSLNSHKNSEKEFYSISILHSFLLDIQVKVDYFLYSYDANLEINNDANIIKEEDNIISITKKENENDIKKEFKKENLEKTKTIEIEQEEPEHIQIKSLEFSKLTFSREDVLYDDDIFSLNKKMEIFNKLSEQDFQNNNTLFIYIKEKIEFLRNHSSRLFFKKIEFLKVIKKYLLSENKYVCINPNISYDYEKNANIIKIQDNVDSVLETTNFLLLNLIT